MLRRQGRHPVPTSRLTNSTHGVPRFSLGTDHAGHGPLRYSVSGVVGFSGGFSECLSPCPGPLAQLAEQRTFNPRVVGSSPTGPTMGCSRNFPAHVCETRRDFVPRRPIRDRLVVLVRMPVKTASRTRKRPLNAARSAVRGMTDSEGVSVPISRRVERLRGQSLTRLFEHVGRQRAGRSVGEVPPEPPTLTAGSPDRLIAIALREERDDLGDIRGNDDHRD